MMTSNDGGPTADPYAAHRVPARLPVDSYLAMDHVNQLRYAKEQASAADVRRRIYLETGRVPSDKYQSGYQDLLKLISDDGFQDAQRGSSVPHQFGSVLKAARDSGELEGTGKSATGNWKTAVSLAKIVGRIVPPAPVQLRNNALLQQPNPEGGGSKAHTSKFKALQSALTNSRTDRVADGAAVTKAKARNSRQRRDRFETAAEPVRKALLRRSSYPSVVGNARALTDQHSAFKAKAQELHQLKKVVDGLEPREEEVVLNKKVHSLERQIDNQIALIKGLREKVKVIGSERDALLEHARTIASLDFDTSSGGGGGGGEPSPLLGSVASFRLPRERAPSLRRDSTAQPPPPIEITPTAAAGPASNRLKSKLLSAASFAGAGGGASFSLGAHTRTASPSSTHGEASNPTPKAKSARQASFVLALINPELKVLTERGAVPLTEAASVVVIDIQSNNHLWETMPEVMKRDSVTYFNAVFECRRACEGYLAQRVGERMCFTFSGPNAAVKFALMVQASLCNAPWSPEVCENPDTPTEAVRGSPNLFVWRGLRVAIGIAHGATSSFDPASQTTVYGGPAMELAGMLQFMAVGGEILTSSDVHGACGGLLSQGTAAAEEFGKLHRHASRATVFRFVNAHQAARMHYFKRELTVAEEAARDLAKDPRSVLPVTHLPLLPPIHHAAPVGTIALVSIGPADLVELQATPMLPEKVLKAALVQYRRLVETLARSNRGHICRVDEHVIDIAFQQPYDAVNMALRLQLQMLEIPWAEELLTVPRCATIKIKNDVVFSGIRLRVGIHIIDNAQPQMDLITGCSHYVAHREGRVASAAASVAAGGETLMTARVVDLVAKNVDRLKYPAFASSTAVVAPTSDALVTVYYLHPNALSQRADFLRREMKLPNEPTDDRTDAIYVAERNMAVLTAKLAEKDAVIKSLERQTEEKTSVIQRMRVDILDADFDQIDVRTELGKLEIGAFYEQAVLIALSFAHVPELLEQWPDEFPQAIAIFDEFANTIAHNYHAMEIRRTQSGAVRVLAFGDFTNALEFWLTVVRNVSLLPWPERLMKSEHAGILMASDVTPGLHASLDTMLWKGLRPIAGLIRGLPDTALNPVTRTMVAAGGCVNDAVMLMRHAGDGELWIQEDLATEIITVTEDRLTNATFDTLAGAAVRRVFPSEMLQRHVDSKRVLARLAAEHSLPVVLRSEVHRVNAFIVHIRMHDSDLFKDTTIFSDDIERFHGVVRELIASTEAHIISSSQTEYLLGFTDAAQGADLAMGIHSALLRQSWSPSLLRLPDCRMRWSVNGLCMAGIRAVCGCHYLEDVTVTVDLVDGADVWVHRELAVPFILTQSAPFGQTMATKQALPFLSEVKRYPLYTEVTGSIVMPTDTVPFLIYACLPSFLRYRAVLFTADAKERQQHLTAESFLRADLRKARRAMALAEAATRDCNAIGDMPAHLPGVNRSFDEVTTDALNVARAQAISAARSRATAETTMSLYETVAMMAHDPFYLTADQKAKNEVPQHQALLFHHLEHSEAAQKPIFDRTQANDLIMRMAFGPGGDDDGDESAAGKSQHGSFNRQASMRRGMSMSLKRVTSMHAADPMAAKTGPTIPVEDAVALHVDVERFTNLVLMFGVQVGKGTPSNSDLLRAWIDPVYDTVCPDGINKDRPDAVEERLRDMSRQTRSLNVVEDTINGVDPHELYASVLANLSLAMQRLVYETK